MLLLRTEKLPEGPDWTYEIKLDGYRALAFKKAGKIHLRSRNDNDFNARYPGIVAALAPLPNDTVIDGEVVVLDGDGRPSFNTLQNYGSADALLHFYVFDPLVLKGGKVTKETLRNYWESLPCRRLSEPIRYKEECFSGARARTTQPRCGTKRHLWRTLPLPRSTSARQASVSFDLTPIGYCA